MNSILSVASDSKLRRAGLTLVEMIVVLAIVAVLVSLAIPAVQKVRNAAARVQCTSNLRQQALAVHQYAGTEGALPQGCAYVAGYTLQERLTWQTSILPYVEQDALWQMVCQANLQDPAGHGALQATVSATPVSIYLCPAETRRTGSLGTGVWALTSYQGVAGTSILRKDGVLNRDFTVRFTDITDGTSNTLMIGERPPGPNGRYGAWYADWGDTICPLAAILAAGEFNSWEPPGCTFTPGPLRYGRLSDPCDVTHFWSLHGNGANFAFADGSVRFLPYSASSILPALATRAGGEVVNVDEY
jgi:prepilin-type N-terminal cleavage/methylation domain-containing protein/prepilin-type processing-associated H-X9-DG protein